MNDQDRKLRFDQRAPGLNMAAERCVNGLRYGDGAVPVAWRWVLYAFKAGAEWQHARERVATREDVERLAGVIHHAMRQNDGLEVGEIRCAYVCARAALRAMGHTLQDEAKE